ncbi:hypothetical protein L1987_38556 [Smallanthus sonchifolius]|uniref:Uncharacterized protein n=1 Tax=Smallanthus sonchifolius TaxID=185202 RepID=A0ACB9HKV8_9ASTR|nr:hypothetical protein L1987_38556 [Smallanthus sonchifolius]
MGAQKSVHAGRAKIDFNVDFTHRLCAAMMVHSFSLCIKHPNLFGKSEKLDVLWDKGLSDSNILIAYRKPRPEWLAQHSFVIQHSVSPEVGIHGVPVDNFSRTQSGGVNLYRFSAGLDLDEPGSSNWSSKTSIKFEFSLQIEQGIPLMSKWLIFNRFKFAASKGVKVGPGFLLASLTGGSIVGDIAPYQAFAIGGLGSVRGYGDGAVGSGRSCLVANAELTFPMNHMLDGALFCDCGTDLGSGRYVPGNPGLRHGKPGNGVGVGYGVRVKFPMGHFQVDYALNDYQQKTIYFGFSNVAS